MLNPCARESKTEPGVLGERNLISDHGQISSYESQPGAANRQDFWGDFPRDLGALDGRMLARAPVSQLIEASTTVDLGTTIFLFLHDVTFEKQRGFGRSIER